MSSSEMNLIAIKIKGCNESLALGIDALTDEDY